MSITLAGNGRTIIFDETTPIGRGGNSIVFKGIISETGEPVAIKVPHRDVIVDETVIKRISQEANLRFDHPNIIRIIDLFHDRGKNIYHLVSEYQEGLTLDQYIKEAKSKNELLPFTFVRKVILDIALALEFLHSQSPIIIHRDVKSSNIIITKDGNAKLMDLGIAKIHDLNNIDITRPGAILGTYHFIPPEQIKPSQYGPITIQSDLYSLGITMYEALTKKFPYNGTNEFELYQNILNCPFPKNNLLNHDLYTFLKKTTEKDRRFRFSNASDLIIELKKFDENGSLSKTGGRNIMIYSFFFVGLLAIFLLSIYPFRKTGQPELSVLCTLLQPLIPNDNLYSLSLINRIENAKKIVTNATFELNKLKREDENPKAFKGQPSFKLLNPEDTSIVDRSDSKSMLLLKRLSERPGKSESQKRIDLSTVDWREVKNIPDSDFTIISRELGITSFLEGKLSKAKNNYHDLAIRISDTLAMSGKYEILQKLGDDTEDYFIKARALFLLNKLNLASEELLKYHKTNPNAIETKFLESNIESFKSNFSHSSQVIQNLLDTLKINDQNKKVIERSILDTKLFMNQKNIIFDTLFISAMFRLKEIYINKSLDQNINDSCLVTKLLASRNYNFLADYFKQRNTKK